MNNKSKKVKLNIPEDEATEVTCPKCNCNTFDIIHKILKVSALSPYNPTKKDIIKPMPYFKCSNKKCGHILKI